MGTLEAKRALEQSIATGNAAPLELPKKLHLELIREIPEVFQPRGPTGPASKAHVRELARTPKSGHPLDPVIVLWAGNGFVLIDGHHRLAAYRFAKWREPIPVSVYPGSLEEAMGHAGKLNSGEKLPMTSREKKALAWKLTIHTKLSKERVRLASGMSDGFVASMRRVYRQLIEKQGMPTSEVTLLSWPEAQKKARGDSSEAELIDWDEKTEQAAQDMANRILKAIGKQGQQNHEALARALEIYDSRLPDSLREHWDNALGQVESFDEDEQPAEF